jgi:transposase-like protein
MRGRIPAGPEYVEQLQGSTKAKERLRALLETMLGQARVQEACGRLGICEQRYRQLRVVALQAALASVEDQPPGRPRRAEESAEIAALRQQVLELQRELRLALVREEVALALPRVSATAPDQATDPASAPKKKRQPKH